jgi:hypothetical protein
VEFVRSQSYDLVISQLTLSRSLCASRLSYFLKFTRSLPFTSTHPEPATQGFTLCRCDSKPVLDAGPDVSGNGPATLVNAGATRAERAVAETGAILCADGAGCDGCAASGAGAWRATENADEWVWVLEDSGSGSVPRETAVPLTAYFVHHATYDRLT